MRANGLVLISEAQAADGSSCVIVGSREGCCSTPLLHIEAAQCTLSNLHIEHAFCVASCRPRELGTNDSELGQFSAIRISGESQALIARCSISCRQGCGIDVGGSARPTIHNCSVEACSDGFILRDSSAVTVRQSSVRNCTSSCIKSINHAEGTVHDNTFENGGHACLLAAGRSSTSFINNKIGDTKGCGIRLCDETTALVEGNHVNGHHMNGLEAGGSSNAMVKGNTIKGSSGSGMVLHDSCNGVFVNNDISGSVFAGVGIQDRADPIFTGNRVSHGAGSGLVLLDEAKGVIDDNRFFKNTCAGIGIKGNACGLFNKNTVCDNEGYGVWMQDTASSTFQNNLVENNSKAGFAVSHQAAPTLHSNRIIGGQQVGFFYLSLSLDECVCM